MAHLKRNILVVLVCATVIVYLIGHLNVKNKPIPCGNQPFNFSFVHISDEHIGNITAGHTLSDAVAFINKMDPAPKFVISTGDQVEDAWRDSKLGALELHRYVSIMDNLNVLYFSTPGNHDVSTQAALNKYREIIGDTDYDFGYGNVRFIVINDAPLVNTGIPNITSAALARVKLVLDEGFPTVVFVHIPIIADIITTRNAYKLLKLLGSYPSMTVVATGHLHRLVVTKWGKTYNISAPDLKIEGHNEILVYKVGDSEIETCSYNILTGYGYQIARIPINLYPIR